MSEPTAETQRTAAEETRLWEQYQAETGSVAILAGLYVEAVQADAPAGRREACWELLVEAHTNS